MSKVVHISDLRMRAGKEPASVQETLVRSALDRGWDVSRPDATTVHIKIPSFMPFHDNNVIISTVRRIKGVQLEHEL